jgi:energy-coupling factor transporter ATP-binding protein EcfA2
LMRLKKAGLTILLVEQNVHLALSVSDYAYVIAEGRLFTEGPDEVAPAELTLSIVETANYRSTIRTGMRIRDRNGSNSASGSRPRLLFCSSPLGIIARCPRRSRTRWMSARGPMATMCGAASWAR